MRIALAALASASVAGCGLTCTLIFAPSHTEVQISGGDWTPGAYELEIQGYNQFAMCVLDLPSDGTEPACTGNASVTLDAGGERIVAFDAVEFAPDSFGLELRRDGQVVAQEQYTPDYAVDQPNGPGCGERRQTTVQLSLP